MTIRVFHTRDGEAWNVWHVRPSAGDDSPLNSRFRDGWLCFKRVDGEERCRMPIGEAPAGWEALSDERLDLLRRVADRPLTVRAAVGPTEERRQASVEEAQHAVESARPPTPGKPIATADEAL